MANVFGILSALLLAVAAFVAHKNKEALAGERNKTQNQQNAFTENQALNQKIADEIAVLQSETDDIVQQAEEADGQLKELNDSNRQAEVAISQKEEDVKRQEAAVEDAKTALADLGSVPDLVREMHATQKSVVDLTDEIGVAEAKLSQLEQTQSVVGGSLNDIRETNRQRRQKQAPADLRTRVRSVYDSWGFVTIAAGDNQNVTKDSVLQVLRDGQPIARLKVTAVEASTAAADILGDSIAEGERLHAGDLVVSYVEQSTSSPAAPTASSSARRASSTEVAPSDDDAADAPEDPADQFGDGMGEMAADDGDGLDSDPEPSDQQEDASEPAEMEEEADDEEAEDEDEESSF